MKKNQTDCGGCVINEVVSTFVFGCPVHGAKDSYRAEGNCQHLLKLVCSTCDATWSDPERARSMLVEWMASQPAFRHNIEKPANDTADERLRKQKG